MVHYVRVRRDHGFEAFLEMDGSSFEIDSLEVDAIGKMK